MRGRVAAVLLLLSFLSLDSTGQCNYVARYSGQFRSTVYDIAVDGSFLWTATGYGAQLLEPTAKGPEIVDAVALPGSTRHIAPRGNDIAYAGSGSKIVVVRRNGRSLEVIRSVDAPGIVNDIAVTSTHLFVATRNGIAHYDLLDATNPTRTSTVLTTSRLSVTSLAVKGDTLYAADGDATVEMFNVSIPSLPQRTGALESLPRSGAVHIGTDGFIYVSDEIGQNTDIFGGTSRIARVPYGSLSFAPTVTGALFVAGGDRTLRALDFSTITRPAELFEDQLAPTGGTSNGIFDIVRSGSTLYVAAGDIGLLTYDISTLGLPYPLLSYRESASNSVVLIEGSTPKAYFSTGSGIVETNLQLAVLRNSSNANTVVDSRGSELLGVSGQRVSIFSPDGPTTFEATFAQAVAEAVITGDTIVALLADQSVWTVKATSGSTPQKLDTGGAKISYIARSGSNYALAEVREDGTTVIHLPSKKFTVDGAATGGLALNATHAAIFTFRGLSLVDLNSGAVSVLPDSTGVLPRQLLLAGTDLLVLGDRTLEVWNTNTRTRTRSHPLPANAVRMHAGAQRAVIATDEGMLAINYLAKLPEPIADPEVNRYYTKAVAGADRLYLFGADGVDVYSTASGAAPKFMTAIREPGLIDVAASDSMFFTLGGDGAVTAYSNAGAVVARSVIEIGTDSQPRAIFTVGNAVWVTLSSGCSAGACGQWTAVLDPNSLARAGLFAGGTVDVAVSGTRAYALLDQPHELASFDITNPLLPSPVAHAGAPPSAVAISFANNRVLVLGDKLFAFTPSLVAAGEFLEASTSTQQQIEADGNCVVVIGRGENPELLDAASLAGAAREVPSTPRSIAVRSGRVYVLTEHSIEIWTVEPPKSPNRRRSAR
jgi:hypothetical protein